MKKLSSIIVLTLFTATLSHASSNYSTMTTQELQIQVEKLSQAGNLPFEMGLELMKRWTKI